SEDRVASGVDGAGYSDASGPYGIRTDRSNTLLDRGQPTRPGSEAGSNRGSASPNQLAAANASGGSALRYRCK
ncbi:MAG: hypothetical protein ACKO38_15460, partial [Planctomycetota bacterium]